MTAVTLVTADSWVWALVFAAGIGLVFGVLVAVLFHELSVWRDMPPCRCGLCRLIDRLMGWES